MDVWKKFRRRSAWSSTFIAGLELAKQGDVVLGQGGISSPFTLPGLEFAAPIAVISVCRICRTAKRGAHGARAGTDGAGNTLAADNLDTGLARMQVIDMTLPTAFGQVSSVLGHARLACRSGTVVGAASIDILEAWPGTGRE